MIAISIDISILLCYHSNQSLNEERSYFADKDTLTKGSDEPQRSRLALSRTTSEINKDSGD